MWYHCVMSTSTNIIIVGSDTDIWVYGMALKEAGWLQNKRVFVERSEFVDINEIQQAVATHPTLSKITHPVNSLVSLYILTGSDYSSFFKTSKQAFLNAFVDHCGYICDEHPLVGMLKLVLLYWIVLILRLGTNLYAVSTY